MTGLKKHPVVVVVVVFVVVDVVLALVLVLADFNAVAALLVVADHIIFSCGQ